MYFLFVGRIRFENICSGLDTIMVADLDARPPICRCADDVLELISKALVDALRDDEADERLAAQFAAHLAEVCKEPPVFRDMARAVWDSLVDPGCVQAARAAAQRRSELEVTAQSESQSDSDVSEQNYSNYSLQDLRAACRAAGVRRTSGFNQAQLLRALHDARVADAARAARGLQLAPKSYGRWKEDTLACPVRGRARELVRALTLDLNPRTREICASLAKSTYSVNEKLLAGLKDGMRTKRNPHYRSAAPMRLYHRVRVARAALAQHGPYLASDPDAVDPMELLRLHEQKAATSQKKKEKRRRRDDQVARELATAGLPDGFAAKVPTVRAAIEKFKDKGGLNDLRAVLTRGRALSTALVEAGLSELPRDDSELCREYMEHGDGDPGAIASVMAEMRFYHDHTDYATICDDIFDKLAAEERRFAREAFGERLHPDEYREIRHQASEEAQVIALEEWAREHVSTQDAVAQNPHLPASLRERLSKTFFTNTTSGQTSRRTRSKKRKKF